MAGADVAVASQPVLTERNGRLQGIVLLAEQHAAKLVAVVAAVSEAGVTGVTAHQLDSPGGLMPTTRTSLHATIARQAAKQSAPLDTDVLHGESLIALELCQAPSPQGPGVLGLVCALHHGGKLFYLAISCSHMCTASISC